MSFAAAAAATAAPPPSPHLTRPPPPSTFRAHLEASLAALGLDRVDLFSFDGVNWRDHIEWITAPGGCLDVVREFQASGRIGHIGFSSHAMTDVVIETIETGVFDFVDLHYQWCGSYTASGAGDRPNYAYEANYAAVQAAAELDMGVIISSPYEKGGLVTRPSSKIASLCGPECTPVEYASLFLWADPKIHTLTVDPSVSQDLDEHIAALAKRPIAETIMVGIEKRLRSARIATLGVEFADSWHIGVPDCYSPQTPNAMHLSYVVWLWTLVKAYGLSDFAQQMYAPLVRNRRRWDEMYFPGADACAIRRKVPMDYAPGCNYSPADAKDARAALERCACPPDNIEVVMQALQEMYDWFAPEGDRNACPLPDGCGAAYDLATTH